MIVMMESRLSKRVYSINEAKEILGVSDDTIRRMIKAKQLEATKVRGMWRIKRASIEQYL